MRHLLLIGLLLPLGLRAQTFKADIKGLSFMTGTWGQHHEWGDMEEFWGPPMGNNMICSYRCVKDGKVLFYEFVVIEQSDSVPVMILRHFKPGSIAWEEKDKPERYPLVSLDRDNAVFASPTVRLTYRRVDPGHMDIVLEEKKDTSIFHYHRL
ncbi:MAG TPA: DUF6265 family protein [Puia sp.]|jgi:hypothetical protein|nr:DUF6265 family protein [Puia sp.]